ncbi:MAG: hypothetical protein PHY30_00685 [Candidatus Pacebacteria bacterium]|nr:hypothetical protein [Candidatus Paceibacterota bacterium]
MKILLLSRLKYESPRSSLYDYIKSQEHDVYFADPSEIDIIINEKNISVLYNNIDVSSVDMVISRNSMGFV